MEPPIGHTDLNAANAQKMKPVGGIKNLGDKDYWKQPAFEEIPLFERNEYVTLFCQNFTESRKGIGLKCIILSNNFCGEEIFLFISNSPHHLPKKIKKEFVNTFWPDQKIRLRSLVHRIFEAKAQKSSYFNERLYHNFIEFKDMGPLSECEIYDPESEQDFETMSIIASEYGITESNELVELHEVCKGKPILLLRAAIVRYIKKPFG